MRAVARCGRCVCLALVSAMMACGARTSTVQPRVSVLRTVGGVAVAHVAGEPVTADEVRAVGQAEGISDPRAALERTITLRLMAREAVRRGLDHDPLIEDLARHASTQSLLAHTIERDIRADNLPERDLQSGIRIRGFDMAHGELWRTTHALITVPASATPAQRAELRARAEAVRAAILALPLPRVDSFRATATAAMRGIASRVEVLPGIDAQGRFSTGEMVEPFTRAATALQHPGDVSDVVETTFGYHVIMLIDTVPALTLSAADVRATVAQDLLWRLRHHALDVLLDQLRGRYHTTVSDQALDRVTHIPLIARGEEGGGS